MCFVKRIPLDDYLEGEYEEITEILEEDVVVFKIVTKHTGLFKNTYLAPFNSYEYYYNKEFLFYQYYIPISLFHLSNYLSMVA